MVEVADINVMCCRMKVWYNVWGRGAGRTLGRSRAQPAHTREDGWDHTPLVSNLIPFDFFLVLSSLFQSMPVQALSPAPDQPEAMAGSYPRQGKSQGRTTTRHVLPPT